ncbi:MAG: FtsX-like permease family protein, partial [Deltaproteobacteria bacterium]|nr:FtsX-like permease family protein [Deltaproteobacteria bacterium]
MTILGIGLRNAWRNRVRAVLTTLGVAVAILAFLFLRTILSAWTAAADHSAKDRLGTRHKVTFILPLPLRYSEQMKQVPGVVETCFANWFGGKNPKDDKSFFGSMAVQSKTFFSVFDELVIDDASKERWRSNRRGAVVGDMLAKKFGWKQGDRITLSGTIYPGDWEFDVDAIYTTSRRSIDRSSFFFHWDYLNESPANPTRDQIGWITTRVSDPSQSASISEKIDRLFGEQEVQTLSMSERAMNMSFMGMMSAVLRAMDVVSVVILAIMALILGNTIAMGVRERTHEYGVLRAIGFLPKHLVAFILGEALIIGALGGALGITLAYPFVEQAVGRFLEENMGAMFPYVRIAPGDASLAGALAVALAALVAAIPAYQASRLRPVD